MANNRRKGHEAEREFVKEFVELGFEHCKTARYASRIHDDAGVDLVNTGPFNVQIKAGKQSSMSISNTIQYTQDRVKELFPEEDPIQNNITVLIHKKPVKSNKRKDSETTVSMTFEDFKRLIKEYSIK